MTKTRSKKPKYYVWWTDFEAGITTDYEECRRKYTGQPNGRNKKIDSEEEKSKSKLTTQTLALTSPPLLQMIRMMKTIKSMTNKMIKFKKPCGKRKIYYLMSKNKQILYTTTTQRLWPHLH